ncbi:hypothetical protein KsCSTR_45820 [Candidatus Kuenenia stuttgartiensis]|uniref:Uncharacterized protein n=1 Tax=Kuenenia stuttgartiensis TaxID=174633 RepID=Q1PWG0_KUEST|nr:hypothetical protein KsCSTR_45820 [Candidatus Kuenenia stuttgartiensis]CAJ71560.1 unknown protein [Candidatus Kuenenia stuttgartiensis]
MDDFCFCPSTNRPHNDRAISLCGLFFGLHICDICVSPTFATQWVDKSLSQ